MPSDQPDQDNYSAEGFYPGEVKFGKLIFKNNHCRPEKNLPRPKAEKENLLKYLTEVQRVMTQRGPDHSEGVRVLSGQLSGELFHFTTVRLLGRPPLRRTNKPFLIM